MQTPTVVYKTLSPSVSLSPFIVRYYNIVGLTSEHAQYIEKTLPNGYTSFVLHFRKKIKVSNVQYNGDDIPQTYVFGKYTNYVQVHHAFGEADIFGVIFAPGAFRYFTRVPQHVFTDKLSAVCDVMGERFRPFLNQMEDLSTMGMAVDFSEIAQKRKAIIEEFFTERLQNISTKKGAFDSIMDDILSCPQEVSLKALSRKHRLTEQYLNRQFKQKIGMSLYKYARIIRFNHLIHAFNKYEEKDLQQLVVDFDYTDLSHLVKDFKKFTGDSPSVYLNKKNELADFLSHY